MQLGIRKQVVLGEIPQEVATATAAGGACWRASIGVEWTLPFVCLNQLPRLRAQFGGAGAVLRTAQYDLQNGGVYYWQGESLTLSVLSEPNLPGGPVIPATALVTVLLQTVSSVPHQAHLPLYSGQAFLPAAGQNGNVPPGAAEARIIIYGGTVGPLAHERAVMPGLALQLLSRFTVPGLLYGSSWHRYPQIADGFRLPPAAEGYVVWPYAPPRPAGEYLRIVWGIEV